MTRIDIVCLLGIMTFGWTCPASADNRMVAAWDARKAESNIAHNLAGAGSPAKLLGVSLMQKTEDLVERPCFAFDGNGAHMVVENAPELNPQKLTLRVWFSPEEETFDEQTALVVKSLPAHNDPWYQYGLFIMDSPDHPRALSFYTSIGGKCRFVEAPNAVGYAGWTHVDATFDGKSLRFFVNGTEKAINEGEEGGIDSYATPLLIGAYANLPKDNKTCFQGRISNIELYDNALSSEELAARYSSEKSEYPAAQEAPETQESDYAKHLNEVLRQPRDVWGEQLMAQGGATYDNIKDYLHPLFLSTGYTNKELGVHSLLWGEDGGQPPYIIPLADGSRLSADNVVSERAIEFFVGAEGKEAYGKTLERLGGPTLDGYYPILRTEYTDNAGIKYSQESFAARYPGMDHIVASVRITASGKASTQLRLKLAGTSDEHIRCSGSPKLTQDGFVYELDLAEGAARTVYLLWSPKSPFPNGSKVDIGVYEEGKEACKRYWDEILSERAVFDVPEPLVMDVQRNHLIQNLIMRYRYSLGAVVYHDSYFQPESNDSVSTLGMFGYTEAFRDAIAQLVGLSKGEQYYANWERGEKLSHAAYYYFLTRDAEYFAKHTPEYAAICEQLAAQIEKDPNGILIKQRHCGDIPTIAYCTFHQTVCWRGMRDMVQVWKALGNDELANRFGPVVEAFGRSLRDVVAKSSTVLPDGSLFVPSMLLEPGESKPYDPITETRIGSYWNLCMPYAFASGLWDPSGEDMGQILKFMHDHGAILLGLLRFNYYPTPIGSFRPGGLPGYYTTGYDNVYLPSYIRMLADQDEADRMVVSFYGKLAHAQTRGTFVSGEGETVGEKPGETYRSCYGTPCSANNTAFLLNLRLMLARESFDFETGLPRGLYLAHATPRQWLEDGKTIRVDNAPTCFGPLSYSITSKIAAGSIIAKVCVPDRDPISELKLRFRLPRPYRMSGVTVNGESYERFDSDKETIDLTGLKGTIEIVAACK